MFPVGAAVWYTMPIMRNWDETPPRLAERAACTGCTACVAVCPRDAIAMAPDAEGFLRPAIDAAKCVRCGACARACPVLHPGEADPAPACFAARTRDVDLRLASASGGLFTELARPVLAAGGVVFGVVLESPGLIAIHVGAEDAAGLAAMRGSKYVQSDPRGTFREARAALRADRRVLYSGTPCQIAGLRRFLGRPEPNLLAVEIVCHSAPSPAVWSAAVRELSAHLGERPRTVRFRVKADGGTWRSGRFAWALADGREGGEPFNATPYAAAFFGSLCSRPSCARCVAKGGASGADLTIGDLWGAERLCPEWNDPTGVSVVAAHTDRGRAALDAVAPRLECRPLPADEAFRANPFYSAPAPAHRGRAWFMAHFRDVPLARATRRALRGPWPIWMARRVLSKARRLTAACDTLFTNREGASSYLPDCMTLPAAA